MVSHVVYIDDSGTKEYAAAPALYSENGGISRYFVFGGVLLTINESSAITLKITALKMKYFGTDQVEIKSNWLRIPSKRADRYLTRFGITDDQLRCFMDDFYQAINEADLLCIGSVVDKIGMQERYPNPYYAPAIAYELLMQRVEREIRRNGICSVVCDDMTGKTPKGSDYKDNLKRQHQILKQKGSRLLDGFSFTCLPPSITFLNSAFSHMIQVADVVAYNVMRQFRDYGEDWERVGNGVLPQFDDFSRIEKKFRTDRNGIVQGYGIVKFPSKIKIPWKI